MLSTTHKPFLIWSHFFKRLEVSAQLIPETLQCPGLTIGSSLSVSSSTLPMFAEVHSKVLLQAVPSTHWPCCESRLLCTAFTAPMFATILSRGLGGARRSGWKGAWRLNCVEHTGCDRGTRKPPPKLDFILNPMRSHWKFQAEQWHDLIYVFQANSQGWVKTGGGAGEEAEWGHYLLG